MGEKRVIEQVASNVVHNDDWFLKDSPTQDTSKISATNLKAILGADGTLALEEIANAIAEEYDSTHTYYNTELVFHEGVLYQCTATSVTGTWDSTKWNVVDIKDLLDNVSTNIGYLWNTISNTIAGSYDTSSTYNTGDYAIYSIKLYRCKDDDVTGAWNSSKWEEVNIPEYIDYVLENAGKVDDVKVDGTSVVTNKVAEIEIPVKDVEVDGTSVVNASGVAEITLPDVPVQDVQVKTDSTYDSVVDASGNAKIDLSSVTAYGEVPNLPQPIATFTDGADAPMKSLKVAIEPQQDLHGYDSPWVGGAGKNICPDKHYQRNARTYVLGTDEDNVCAFPLVSGQSYTFSLKTSVTTQIQLYVREENQSTATPYTLSNNVTTFTPSITGNYILVLTTALQDTPFSAFSEIMFEKGSTKTSFAPYSNICPISGWSEVDVTRTGKNLYSHNGISIYDYAFSQQIAFSQMRNPIFMKSGQKYVLSLSENITLFRMRAFDKFQNLVTNASIINAYNQGSGTGLVFYENGNFFGYNGAGANSITTFQPTEDIWFDMTVQTTSPSQVMFEIGDTPSTYEPYNGQTYTIPFTDAQGNPIEVFGGEVDVVSGTLTVDRIIKTLNGSESWNYYDTADAFYLEDAFEYVSSNFATSETNNICLCNMYKEMDSVGNSASLPNRPTGTFCGQTGAFYKRVWIKDTRYTTAEAFKTMLSSNNLHIVYPLATPLTIQLTPTAVKSLLGTNNIWADTGDIDKAEYQRDATTIINELIARIEALEG